MKPIGVTYTITYKSGRTETRRFTKALSPEAQEYEKDINSAKSLGAIVNIEKYVDKPD